MSIGNEEKIGQYRRPQGYSHHKHTKLDNSKWMSHLDDNLFLHQINIIGTHETMAFRGGDAVICQRLPLIKQYIAGIRFVDIRCNHHDDDFYIHHGFVSQKSMFIDVLEITTKFLQENPSETIYMRIKHEYKRKNNNKTFEQVFDEQIEKYRSYIWDPSSNPNPQDPLLKETRGKIVVVQQFTTDKTYGVQWRSPYVNIQDQYHFKHNWNLFNKWELIKKHINAANDDISSSNLYINFLSASRLSFPYFVASGQSSPQTIAPRLLTGIMLPATNSNYEDFPRFGCSCYSFVGFEGTNNLVINYIKKNPNIKKIGIILADFPGPDLINLIISMNQIKDK
ncbi:Phosphatidylinositol-specific phospholipase C, X domain containing protein [Trichomonas vaginalis G3]|uniref:Phosphatidylinositol-specific phospholipase C, X domain containing protein n=1 Tax=Trichomonas vaginalis (strain ATCC PRA-98 / G3) TaxID=412133 RepID=A2E5C9_TRIV3|nr:phosphoric diester hydrolase protein [Trichomonas vaginalis G3]EAY12090.1 Phosphatidylinositol-specific phospholipase C, X domain containing protein [Trichomonas vaginalis G3]KAI5542456.1 phosphoric diester hydrolase protein [Trichomonas vaginalis G3]|eukprot:XP_001324313.1 Phosphatidylinositol-specific phospholipase C, X domain containing protein [Trichomonas vaginalis G3]